MPSYNGKKFDRDQLAFAVKCILDGAVGGAIWRCRGQADPLDTTSRAMLMDTFSRCLRGLHEGLVGDEEEAIDALYVGSLMGAMSDWLIAFSNNSPASPRTRELAEEWVDEALADYLNAHGQGDDGVVA